MTEIKLTQEQFNELQRLFNKGDRAGYYLKYYEYTDNDQSLEMAHISSFASMHEHLFMPHLGLRVRGINNVN